jgi:hypothetical protein
MGSERSPKVGGPRIESGRVLAVAFSGLAVTRHTILREQSFAVGFDPTQAFFLRLLAENLHQRISLGGGRSTAASGCCQKGAEPQPNRAGVAKPSFHGFLPERSVESVMRYAVSERASSGFKP